jgi:hydrogenase maturation protein HypF
LRISALAIGGHQKVALALANGATAVLGPHVGDMDSLVMRQHFVTHMEEMLLLYGCRPEFIACDQHPDYFTTRWATEFAKLTSVRQVVPVQHHHAHVASAMVEQGWINEMVLGVAFDGTGYGTAGTVWGGEFLLANLSRFDRVGHLVPFRLPGGDRATREPWRVALALLREAYPMDDVVNMLMLRVHSDVHGDDERCGTSSAASLSSLLRTMQRSPVTTSAGRLFDGAACLILGIAGVSYEGEAAMLLESACDDSDNGCYDMPILPGSPSLLDWRPAVRFIVRDARAGTAPGQMAMRFHRGLARAVAALCGHFPAQRVVISGGVFQNRRLVELIASEIPETRLGLPNIMPANDGGLAVGQLAVASALINQASMFRI